MVAKKNTVRPVTRMYGNTINKSVQNFKESITKYLLIITHTSN